MTTLRLLPLIQFLQNSRRTLKACIDGSKPVHLVTGNESVDLDSFASSILYAYLSYPRNDNPPQFHPPIIPLLPIPRVDLALRPEFLYLLKVLKLPALELIFLDDIPQSTLSGQDGADKNEVILVDHNVLQVRIFAPERTIVRGIIDHHKDEGKYLDANPRIIDISGSCASLVTTWRKKLWPKHKDEARELAKLALAPILIDTTNMKQKVTEHDKAAVAFLEEKLGGGGVVAYEPEQAEEEGTIMGKQEPWNSTAFYNALSEAKSSLDGLLLRDILRKDYKEWTTTSNSESTNPTLTIGISSVVKPLSYLISTPRGGEDKFLSTLSDWAQERKLDVVSVMTAYTGDTGEFRRELLVWVVSEEGERTRYMKRFVSWAEGEEGGLGLKDLGAEVGRGLEDEKGLRRVWRQGNTQASRKQVAPGMRGCL